MTVFLLRKNIYNTFCFEFKNFLFFILFLFLIQTIFLSSVFSMNPSPLDEDQQNQIIAAVRKNNYTMGHMLNNIQR